MLILLLTTSAVIVSFWVWKVLVWAWWTPRKLEIYLRKQGIKGTPRKFLYGDTKQNSILTRNALSKPVIDFSHAVLPRVMPFFHQTVERYGPLCFTWNGEIPRLIIMEPELIREVLSNKFRDFASIRLNPFTKFIAAGLLSYEGEKWAKHRRIINPAFHHDKLKMMIPAFYASCSELVSRWEKLVSDIGSCELDVWPEIKNFTGDVISRTAFGSSYEEGRLIFQLQLQQAKLVVLASQSLYIPGLRFLPTKRNKRMSEIDKEVKTILRDMINKREKAKRADQEDHSNDLLGLLLDSNLKESQRHHNSYNNVGMTMDEVVEECKLFYNAGQETTSTLLVWTLVLLSMHPEWQKRAREEVLQVFGTNKPDFDGLNHLKIVTMILCEVLRLYPPVVFITRYNYTKTKLGKFSLPPGIQVALPILLVHHDRSVWGEDADEFKPERFSEGISKATKNQCSFFPFGWGPRICLGQTFAMIESKMVLAMILQRFSFDLSPTYVHAPYTVFTLQPQHGAPIILCKL